MAVLQTRYLNFTASSQVCISQKKSMLYVIPNMLSSKKKFSHEWKDLAASDFGIVFDLCLNLHLNKFCTFLLPNILEKRLTEN
jgi:hypothetical protein